jgi:hypothetical protein
MRRGSDTVIGSMKKMRSVVLAAFALTLVACGDPDTNDPRGYTKAPIENPGWTVEGEEPTAMAELGDPIRIPSMDTATVDTTSAPGAQPTTSAPATNPQPPAPAQ